MDVGKLRWWVGLHLSLQLVQQLGWAAVCEVYLSCHADTIQYYTDYRDIDITTGIKVIEVWSLLATKLRLFRLLPSPGPCVFCVI